MLSKNQTKRITSLKQKKYRQQEGVFVVEGIKSVTEFLNSSYTLDSLFTDNEAFIKTIPEVAQKNAFSMSTSALKKISFLATAQQVVALFKIPQPQPINNQGITVVLDDIRDPGNLGTITRLCDWFGVTDLVCSEQTVDCYNPKVVQATMGSLSRVQITYRHLEVFLKADTRPILGTFMDGKSLYTANPVTDAILVMGNESHGISDRISPYITTKITIPQFGKSQSTESLNVATATAICLSELFRPR